MILIILLFIIKTLLVIVLFLFFSIVGSALGIFERIGVGIGIGSCVWIRSISRENQGICAIGMQSKFCPS